ncbi:hypothetical protein STUTZSP0542_11760 [Stutzerimonas marianensis]
MPDAVLATMKTLIEERFQAFKSAPSYESNEQLIGAAHLVQAVADCHSNKGLSEFATYVIEWLKRWDEAQEHAAQLEMQICYQEDDARNALHRQCFRAVKSYVGTEAFNPLWGRLVQRYKEEFPTFQIKDSVFSESRRSDRQWNYVTYCSKTGVRPLGRCARPPSTI